MGATDVLDTSCEMIGPRGTILVEGHPGRNLQAATSTSVHGPSVRRERSFTFREFGLHASSGEANYSSRAKSSSSPTKPAAVPDPVPDSAPTQTLYDDGPESNPYYYLDLDEWPAYAITTNNTRTSFPAPSHFSADTSDDEHSGFHDYASGSRTPSPPRSPVTPISPPRWDSLNYSPPTAIYRKTHHAGKPSLITVVAPGSARPPSLVREQQVVARRPTRFDSLSPKTTTFFPPPTPVTRFNMNLPESRPIAPDVVPVGSFSRPRRPSVKQSSPDPSRYRPGSRNSPPMHSDSAHPEPLGNPNHHLWVRERGLSNSSNKSTSTFASLPVRPTADLQYRDSVRGRTRHAYPPLARQQMAYSRTESSGHSFTRDPLPLSRMASMPSDELRSSFRSQLSASTTPGTVQTERSSVLTKSSSITSIYAPVDDGYSVDDIMGIYEKGFRDDSPAPDQQDDDSRPPTAKSELSRRRTTLLDALTNLPLQRAYAAAPAQEVEEIDVRPDSAAGTHIRPPTAEVRDSAAIFSAPRTLPADLEEVVADESKHDSAKVMGNDVAESFPSRQQRVEPVGRTSLENIDVTRDQYGFRKENQYVTQAQHDAWNKGYSEYMARRRRKWQVYMKENELITDNPIRFPPRCAKTKRFVRKGIPAEWRGAAWFYYAGGPSILAKHGGVYQDLLTQKAKDIDREAIERDLHRTFPDNLKFRAANTSSGPNTESQETRSSQATVTDVNGNAAKPNETQMISSLRRVLHAFSIYNPRIGYCQSLNFLAGLLLLFTETEEQAFWLLNIITRVYLPGTHETSLEGANVDLGVLMTSVQESMPAVWAKIGGELDGTDAVKPKSRRHRKGAIPTRLPPVTLCMTAWFMSCFIGTLPIETTLRVWDVFFYEGSKTLFRIALTIFKQGENEIRSVADPMEIFQVVQTIPRKLLDANALMEACFKRRNGFGHISQETIEERRMERRKNVKLEKERIATGLTEDDFKRKNNLFGRK